HGHHWAVQFDVARGSVEGGVPEAEDAAVGADHPVALAGRGGHGTQHGAVEPGAAHVAVWERVAEGEDAAPAGEDPIAVAAGGCGEADGPFAIGKVEGDARGGSAVGGPAVVGGVAAGDNRAVG